jgi:multicopper oxidase
MHPHGIFYTSDMDGSYKGKYTDPGGFVEHGRTFQYVWEAREGTEGARLYHDHGPMDPVPVFKGLFGPLVIRKPGAPVPEREFFLACHSFVPLATGLDNNFSCVNGRAYAGNTPTLRAQVDQTVAFHVFAPDDDFHTFHLHGHRGTDPDGVLAIENKTLGPGDGPDTMHSVTEISTNDLGLDSDPHNGIFLAPRRVSLAGATLHFALDDSSVVDADVWHVSHGHRAAYAGWEQWRGHIGFNEVRFASRGPHFKPRPGRYVAFLTPTDFFNNIGRTRALHFTISAPHRRHHQRAS